MDKKQTTKPLNEYATPLRVRPNDVDMHRMTVLKKRMIAALPSFEPSATDIFREALRLAVEKLEES